MRTSHDVAKVNIPRTIAGIEWKLVVVICAFFGMSALSFRAPLALIGPVIMIFFLSGPGRRDPDFLRIIRRHSQQKDAYSPAYVCAVNLRTPRPAGFSRLGPPNFYPKLPDFNSDDDNA